MNEENNYLQINRELWNMRTPIHLESEFYNMKAFMETQNSLNPIELNLLGDIKDKTILHLQCHFGQDTISLAKLGAEVIGVDFSEIAINAAQKIADKLNSNAQFIVSDVYQLPDLLDVKFDYVFSSYGTIGWLPNLNKWAQVIAGFLKPGGKLVFVEFHPAVWMFDDNFEQINYNYFNVQSIIETELGTYTDKNANIKNKSISWNHPLSEVFSALRNNDLQIKDFEEYNYSPYRCFNQLVQIEPGKYQIKHFEDKFPMVYAIVAERL